MEQIPEIDLKTLVEEASSSLIEEKKRGASGMIKAFFQKTEQLTKEIKELEKQKAKKQQSLDDTLKKIEEIKGGNWSYLQEVQKEKIEENNKTE